MIATYAASTCRSMICSLAMACVCAYCDGLAPSPQIHLARRSTSADVAGSGCVRVASPWRSAFVRTRRLPCVVVGPVLLVALFRLAAIFFGEVISSLRELSPRVGVVSSKSASFRRCHRGGGGLHP